MTNTQVTATWVAVLRGSRSSAQGDSLSWTYSAQDPPDHGKLVNGRQPRATLVNAPVVPNLYRAISRAVSRALDVAAPVATRVLRALLSLIVVAAAAAVGYWSIVGLQHGWTGTIGSYVWAVVYTVAGGAGLGWWAEVRWAKPQAVEGGGPR